MIVPIFSRLLVPERLRRQADMTGAGFARPAMAERPVEQYQTPLLVTNMSGQFVSVQVSQHTGKARYAFCECPPASEPVLLPRLWAKVAELGGQQGWGNRCTSIAEALDRMKAQGLVPRSMVVAYSLLGDVCQLDRQTADALMSAQGHVMEIEGLQILVSDLPQDKAFVAASPALLGYYTRTDDHLGLMFTQVDKTLILVDTNAMA